MYYGCCNIGFKDGIPMFEQDKETYHVLDGTLRAPKSKIKVGDLVVIKSIDRPLVKVVCATYEDDVERLPKGGNIIGKGALLKAKVNDAEEVFK